MRIIHAALLSFLLACPALADSKETTQDTTKITSRYAAGLLELADECIGKRLFLQATYALGKAKELQPGIAGTGALKSRLNAGIRAGNSTDRKAYTAFLGSKAYRDAYTAAEGTLAALRKTAYDGYIALGKATAFVLALGVDNDPRRLRKAIGTKRAKAAEAAFYENRTIDQLKIEGTIAGAWRLDTKTLEGKVVVWRSYSL